MLEEPKSMSSRWIWPRTTSRRLPVKSWPGKFKTFYTFAAVVYQNASFIQVTVPGIELTTSRFVKVAQSNFVFYISWKHFSQKCQNKYNPKIFLFRLFNRRPDDLFGVVSAPDVKEAVPGPGTHGFAIFGHADAADAIVVAGENTGSLDAQHVPHVHVRGLVSGEQKSSRFREREGGHAADDVVVSVVYQLLHGPRPWKCFAVTNLICWPSLLLGSVRPNK